MLVYVFNFNLSEFSAAILEEGILHKKHVCAFFNAQVFVGNSDVETVVKHPLTPPIKARYIRLTPTARNIHISMRMELYGCFGN